MLAIIITGVLHDILVSLFTARIYYINSQGEKKHLADTMVLRGLDGYRLKIPGSVLKDVDIPMYHIEFKRLLVSRYKNRSIVVECEGFKKDLPMECSMDFVL